MCVNMWMYTWAKLYLPVCLYTYTRAFFCLRIPYIFKERMALLNRLIYDYLSYCTLVIYLFFSDLPSQTNRLHIWVLKFSHRRGDVCVWGEVVGLCECLYAGGDVQLHKGCIHLDERQLHITKAVRPPQTMLSDGP